MKKVFLVLVVLLSFTLNSCTDNTLNEIEERNELQSTEPGNSGQVDTEDEEETGN